VPHLVFDLPVQGASVAHLHLPHTFLLLVHELRIAAGLQLTHAISAFPPFFLQGPGTDRAEVARMREAMTASPPKAVTVTLLNYRKDGSPFWNALHVAPVRDAEGVLEYFIGVQLDVTQQQEKEHQGQQAAAVDEHSAGGG
jgi:PAS domain-containing protein